jgi:hypothetical protein
MGKWVTLDWDDEPIPGSTLLIRSDWEPYRMAFWINEWMHIGLVVHPKPLVQIKPSGTGKHALFRHAGNEVDPFWWLTTNKPDEWTAPVRSNQGQLFETDPEPERLLPKSAEWDYFLVVKADHHNELLTKATRLLAPNPAIFATLRANEKDNQYLLGLMPD